MSCLEIKNKLVHPIKIWLFFYGGNSHNGYKSIQNYMRQSSPLCNSHNLSIPLRWKNQQVEIQHHSDVEGSKQVQ